MLSCNYRRAARAAHLFITHLPFLSPSPITERNRVRPSVSGGRILFLSLYVKGLISCAHVDEFITFAYEIATQIRCNFAALHLIPCLRKSTRSFHVGRFMFASTKATMRGLTPDGNAGVLKSSRRLYIQVRGCAWHGSTASSTEQRTEMGVSGLAASNR